MSASMSQAQPSLDRKLLDRWSRQPVDDALKALYNETPDALYFNKKQTKTYFCLEDKHLQDIQGPPVQTQVSIQEYKGRKAYEGEGKEYHILFSTIKAKVLEVYGKDYIKGISEKFKARVERKARRTAKNADELLKNPDKSATSAQARPSQTPSQTLSQKQKQKQNKSPSKAKGLKSSTQPNTSISDFFPVSKKAKGPKSPAKPNTSIPDFFSVSKKAKGKSKATRSPTKPNASILDFFPVRKKAKGLKSPGKSKATKLPPQPDASIFDFFPVLVKPTGPVRQTKLMAWIPSLSSSRSGPTDVATDDELVTVSQDNPNGKGQRKRKAEAEWQTPTKKPRLDGSHVSQG
ncbi:hypothetical protein C8J56DRAFT_937680 [Mycena floridula]|nr:hypothetical protein C8J56DRAFT_937680 [Mycena floridula]